MYFGVRFIVLDSSDIGERIAGTNLCHTPKIQFWTIDFILGTMSFVWREDSLQVDSFQVVKLKSSFQNKQMN